ncbi:MAG: SIR2 family NAD-dependent protein deacylase [Candidatus Hydrothermia bacterium]
MDEILYLADLIKTHHRIFVLSGAGISTESGIPDFRGPGGLYSKYPPYMFEIDFLKQDPDQFYSIYRDLLKTIVNAQPNTAHFFIAKLEKVGKIQLVATQNIDGLHQKAGSEKVVELHGNATRFYCEKCSTKYEFDDVYKTLLDGKVPRCKCGGIIRPDVIFFGEPLKEKDLREAFKNAEIADLHLVLGSSLVVYPAASLPLLAIENRIPLVIINMGETQLDPFAHIKIEAPLGKVCSKLIELLAL